MALIVLPGGQQQSGSIGGTVYSHNRAGAYVRNRSVPVNPNTDRQVAARNTLRALAIAWQNTLTEEQRGFWEAYASLVPWLNKLGQAIFLTGLAHYVRTNSSRIQAGLARLDDAPTTYNLAPAEGSLVASASEATGELSIAFDDTLAWCETDGAYQAVFMGIPVNPGLKFFGGPFRYAGAILGDSVSPPTTPETITAPFPFVEGQRIWVRTRIGLADGRLSEFAQSNFLAGA